MLRKTQRHRWVQAKMDVSFTSFVSLLSAITFLLLIPGDSCIDIIGGNEAYPHSRPYMAFIVQENYICGGALIQEDWVVTAAHCAIEKGTTTVILGAHSLSKKEPEQQIMTVKEQFPHPHYNSSTNEGDLQLLQLNVKAKITNAVKLLNLPKKGKDVKHGTTCQAAGWGRMTNDLETIPDTLREVNVTIIDREICQDEYSFLHFVGPNMICAGDPSGGKGTCGGDSGGPLICEDTFVGITSFGPEKCGDPNLPGVYTFLSTEYLNWIRNTIKAVV